MTPRLVSYEGAAHVLGDVSVSTVKRLVRRGDLQAIRVLGSPRIRVADIDTYLAQQPNTKDVA